MNDITSKEVLEAAIQDTTPTGCVATFSWDGITLRVVMGRGGFDTNFELPLTEEDCGDTDALTAMLYKPMFDAGQVVGNMVAAARSAKATAALLGDPPPDTHAVRTSTVGLVAQSCVKCGSHDIKTKFMAAKPASSSRDARQESLKKTCGGCGYTWNTATLDQVQA